MVNKTFIGTKKINLKNEMLELFFVENNPINSCAVKKLVFNGIAKGNDSLVNNNASPFLPE